jgi:hypothetical protein
MYHNLRAHCSSDHMRKPTVGCVTQFAVVQMLELMIMRFDGHPCAATVGAVAPRLLRGTTADERPPGSAPHPQRPHDAVLQSPPDPTKACTCERVACATIRRH